MRSGGPKKGPGPKKDPVRGRRQDMVVARAQEARLRGLQKALLGFIEQFGYRLVRRELTEAKRAYHDRRAKAERDLEKSVRVKASEKFDNLQHIWMEVEYVRSDRPGMSAKEASTALAKTGGILAITTSDPRLGVGPLPHSHVGTAGTIYRQWKRAERLRRANPEVNAIWRKVLRDMLGRPPETYNTAPWCPSGAKGTQNRE